MLIMAEGMFFSKAKAFLSLSSVPGLHLDVTTRRDSYAWNYREQVSLITLSDSLAVG